MNGQPPPGKQSPAGSAGSGSAGGQWMTVRELAERSGASLDTVQARIQRGRWRQQRTPDGRVLVLVPSEALPPAPEPGGGAPTPPVAATTAVAGGGGGGESGVATGGGERSAAELITVYENLVEELRRRAEQAESREQAIQSRSERVKRVTDQLRSELEAAQDETRRLRETRSDLMNRLDAAQAEVSRLQAELEEARRLCRGEQDARLIAESRLGAFQEQRQRGWRLFR